MALPKRYTTSTIKAGDIPEFDEAKILVNEVLDYSSKGYETAAKALGERLDAGMAEARDATGKAIGMAQPFAEAAKKTLTELQTFLGMSGSATDQANIQQKLENLPGYKFQLEQGQSALERSQAARGGLLSGRAMKEAMSFGQGLASNAYGAHLDRLQGLLGQTSPFLNQQITMQNQLGANLLSAQLAGGQSLGGYSTTGFNAAMPTIGNLFGQAYQIRDEELTAAGQLGYGGQQGGLAPYIGAGALGDIAGSALQRSNIQQMVNQNLRKRTLSDYNKGEF